MDPSVALGHSDRRVGGGMDLLWRVCLPALHVFEAEGSNVMNISPFCRGCQYRIQADRADKRDLK